MTAGRDTVALGVDIATASVRAHAVDVATGDVVGEARVALPPPSAGIEREQDPVYVHAVTEAVRRVAAALGPDGRSPVRALSVTATSGTVVPVTTGGTSGRAVMYDDHRVAAGRDALGELAPDRPVTMLARVAVAADAHPGSRIVSVADLVNEWLVGGPVPGDTSHWVKAGLDPRSGSWEPTLLTAAGIDVGVLPERLVRPGTVLGTVGSVAANDLGLGPDVLVVAGMTDGCTSQLATGLVHPGDSVGVVGTTLVVKGVSGSPLTLPGHGLYSHRAPDGLFWPGGASNVGGGVLAGSPVELDRAAAPLGPGEVVWYPLAQRGERFPVVDPTLDSLVVDLMGRPASVPADPARRHRVALEGVALVERLALERLADHGVELVRHGVSGGGSASALWNRIRASALGRPVVVARHRASGYGAAVLAAWPLVGGAFGDHVARLSAPSHVVDPEPAWIGPLDERFALLTAALASRHPPEG